MRSMAANKCLRVGRADCACNKPCAARCSARAWARLSVGSAVMRDRCECAPAGLQWRHPDRARYHWPVGRDVPGTLPSSTPHWSKLLMPQMEPLTKTRCSCRAMSAPGSRCEGIQQQKRAGPVSGEVAVAIWVGLCQASRPGPGQRVGQQQVVVTSQGVLRLAHGHKLHRHHVRTLVQHLEVGVLAIGAGSPHSTGEVPNGSASPCASTRVCRCFPFPVAAGRPAGVARRCGRAQWSGW